MNLTERMAGEGAAVTSSTLDLAVWILEGFMSGLPKELDETACVDSYWFPRCFLQIFVPTIKAGIGVAMFFCLIFLAWRFFLGVPICGGLALAVVWAGLVFWQV